MASKPEDRARGTIPSELVDYVNDICASITSARDANSDRFFRPESVRFTRSDNDYNQWYAVVADDFLEELHVVEFSYGKVACVTLDSHSFGLVQSEIRGLKARLRDDLAAKREFEARQARQNAKARA